MKKSQKHTHACTQKHTQKQKNTQNTPKNKTNPKPQTWPKNHTPPQKKKKKKPREKKSTHLHHWLQLPFKELHVVRVQLRPAQREPVVRVRLGEDGSMAMYKGFHLAKQPFFVCYSHLFVFCWCLRWCCSHLFDFCSCLRWCCSHLFACCCCGVVLFSII